MKIENWIYPVVFALQVAASVWMMRRTYRGFKRHCEYLRYSELLSRLCHEARGRAEAANARGDQPAFDQALAEWRTALNKWEKVIADYFPRPIRKLSNLWIKKSS